MMAKVRLYTWARGKVAKCASKKAICEKCKLQRAPILSYTSWQLCGRRAQLTRAHASMPTCDAAATTTTTTHRGSFKVGKNA